MDIMDSLIVNRVQENTQNVQKTQNIKQDIKTIGMLLGIIASAVIIWRFVINGK